MMGRCNIQNSNDGVNGVLHEFFQIVSFSLNY